MGLVDGKNQWSKMSRYCPFLIVVCWLLRRMEPPDIKSGAVAPPGSQFYLVQHAAGQLRLRQLVSAEAHKLRVAHFRWCPRCRILLAGHHLPRRKNTAEEGHQLKAGDEALEAKAAPLLLNYGEAAVVCGL